MENKETPPSKDGGILRYCSNYNKSCRAINPQPPDRFQPKYSNRSSAQCKTCHHDRSDRWRRNNIDRRKAIVKRNRIKTTYGLSEKQYRDLFLNQNKCCAICGKEGILEVTKGEKISKILHVDHCHETSTVRGLLCLSCNRMLGLAKDNSEILRKASIYLDVNKP